MESTCQSTEILSMVSSVLFYIQLAPLITLCNLSTSMLSFVIHPHEKISGRFADFRYKTAFFRFAWWREKVLPRPRSCLIPIKLDQSFKMRYSMSLNSHWIQKYQPSKLNNRKNVRFSTKQDVFFDHSTLTAGIFGTNGSSKT